MESKIKSLLEKFFEGNSSLQEEQELKNFFLKNELTGDFKTYLPLFQLFKAEKAIELSDVGFRQKVIDSIVSDLVEKYFEGTSSINEEKTLKAYFSGSQVSDNLKTYQPIFNFSENEVGLHLGSSFDSKLKTELIKSTLDQYFEGESTVEEEAQLKTYFAGNEVAEELKSYAPLFEYYEHEASQEVSRAFDLKLQKKLQPAESAPADKRQPVVRRMFPQMMRAAAAIALAVGAFWFINSGSNSMVTEPKVASIDWSKYEPKDPEEAYKKTMAALAMVSTKMEEGKEQTLKGMSKINTANKAAGM